MKQIAAYWLLFFLLAVPASAASFEAYLSSQPTTFCSCNLFEESLVIKNVGHPQIFTVDLSGTAAGFVQPIEPVFIGTGQVRVLPIKGRIPCSASSGAISFNVLASNGEEQQIIENMPVQQCTTTIITPLKTTDNVNPCEPLTYSFSVRNAASVEETYSFSATAFKDDVQFLPERITLQPNQETTVSVAIPLTCDVFGEYAFNIRAKAENAGITQRFPAEAIIQRNYPFSMNFGKVNQSFSEQSSAYEFCKDESYAIPVKLTNQANINNAFTLKAGSGAQVIPNKILVGPNQEAIVALVYRPKKARNESVLLEASTILGDIKQRVQVPINVEQCYDLTLDLPLVAKVEQNGLQLPINFQGTQDTRVRLATSKENLLGLPGSITIDESTSITAQPLAQEATLQLITFTAELPNGKQVKDTALVVFGDPLLYKYRYALLIGAIAIPIIIALIIVIIVILVKRSKNKPKKEQPRPKKSKIKPYKESRVIKRIRKQVSFTPKEKPVKEPKKKRNWWWILPVAIVLLILIALALPTKTLGSSFVADDLPSGRIFTAQNKLVRIDHASTNVEAMTIPENAATWNIGKATYVSMNNIDQTQRLTLNVSNDIVQLRIRTTDKADERIDQYIVNKAYLYISYGKDSVRDPFIGTILIVLLAIIILLILGCVGNKKRDEKQSNQFESL